MTFSLFSDQCSHRCIVFISERNTQSQWKDAPSVHGTFGIFDLWHKLGWSGSVWQPKTSYNRPSGNYGRVASRRTIREVRNLRIYTVHLYSLVFHIDWMFYILLILSDYPLPVDPFSQFVNFLAKVVQPNVVEVQEMVSAGNNLDVNQYNQTVELMHSAKFSHLFL